MINLTAANKHRADRSSFLQMLAVLAPTMPTQTGCGGSNVPIPSHDSWADDCSTQRESVEAVAKRVAQLSESHQEELQCLQAVNDSLQ